MGEQAARKQRPRRGHPSEAERDPNYRGPHPLTVEVFDREDDDPDGPWTSRRHNNGLRALHLHQFYHAYQDKGILHEEEGFFLVRSLDKDEPNGARVEAAPDSPMKFIHRRCHKGSRLAGRPDRGCYHVDLVRCHAGLTKVLKQGQPFNAKGTVRKQVAPEQVEDEEVGSEPAHEGAARRKQTRAKTPNPLKPVTDASPVQRSTALRARITRPDGSVIDLEARQVPLTHVSVVGQGLMACIPQETESPVLVEMTDAATWSPAEWAHRVVPALFDGPLHRRDLPEHVVPGWTEIDAAAQVRIMTKLSSALKAPGFIEAARSVLLHAGRSEVGVIAEPSNARGRGRETVWRLSE